MLRENWTQIPHEMEIFTTLSSYFHAGITIGQLIFHIKQK